MILNCVFTDRIVCDHTIYYTPWATADSFAGGARTVQKIVVVVVVVVVFVVVIIVIMFIIFIITTTIIFFFARGIYDPSGFRNYPKSCFFYYYYYYYYYY